MSHTLVAQAKAAGRLRGYRPGGTKIGWRIRESAVREFIERREADAESASRDGDAQG
jgi:hypothetical protein